MGVANKFGAIVVIGIMAVMGFFLFPGINKYIQGVDTSGFNNIMAAEVSIIPFAIIGAIVLAAVVIFAGKGRQG